MYVCLRQHGLASQTFTILICIPVTALHITYCIQKEGNKEEACIVLLHPWRWDRYIVPKRRQPTTTYATQRHLWVKASTAPGRKTDSCTNYQNVIIADFVTYWSQILAHQTSENPITWIFVLVFSFENLGLRTGKSEFIAGFFKIIRSGKCDYSHLYTPTYAQNTIWTIRHVSVLNAHRHGEIYTKEYIILKRLSEI